MPLKRLYKQLVPEGVRNRVAGHPWVERLRTQQLVRQGERLAAATVAHGADGRIHVTFVVQRPALWCNHASIYEAMHADPAFEVSVIAVPKRPPAAADVDLAEYARLQAYLNAKGIPFHCGYDLDTRIWINPLTFGLPDVVFLPQPYPFTQSYLYGSDYWSRFCRVAYVHYGIPMADMPEMQYELPVYADCRYIFVESEAHKELFRAHAPALAERLHVTGHPKLDAYRGPVPADLGLWKCPTAKHRIIWAPHFTVTDDRTPHTFSNFFQYYEFFLDCAKAHPAIEFVLRPHPELFEHMVATGIKTRAESNAYRDRFNALPNGQVYEGGDIFEMFKESDAMILDSLGFLAEYLPTRKPICFLDSSRRQRLNPVGEALLAAYYKAWTPADVEKFICEVVLAGRDVLQGRRMEAMRHNLFLPAAGAGREIAEYVRKNGPVR